MLVHLNGIGESEANVTGVAVEENEGGDFFGLCLEDQPGMNRNAVGALDLVVFKRKVVLLGTSVAARVLARSARDGADFWRGRIDRLQGGRSVEKESS